LRPMRQMCRTARGVCRTRTSRQAPHNGHASRLSWSRR
jgi:hypothetical protein